jgi:hypothetical protein
MFRAPLTLSLAALVAVNFIPLVGVLRGDFALGDVMMLFWAENVVIGLYNLLRMLTLLVVRRDRSVLFFAPFFVFHYGLFCLVHGFFIVTLFGGTGGWSELVSKNGLLWPLLALVVSHGLSYVVNFVLAGEFRATDTSQLMRAPYARIIVLHVTIILGAGAVLALGSPIMAVAMLIVLKTAVDIVAHVREHRKLAGRG